MLCDVMDLHITSLKAQLPLQLASCRVERIAQRHEDVLMAIPVHVGPTSALYDRVAVIEDGRIADWWDVTSRNRTITV